MLKEQKMLRRKIKHVCSVLILHQVSVYSPCWRPITDAVKLLWKLKGIHTSMASNLRAQLRHEPDLRVSSLMRRQGMVEIIYWRGTLCIPANGLSSKQRQNTRITDLALGKMILKVFPNKLGVFYNMDTTNPSVPSSDILWQNKDLFLQSKTPNWPIIYERKNRE